MTYCPNCGAPIEFAVPEGDDRERNICTATGEIFYDNPRNVVGCIVEQNGRILMCRRAISPRLGFWTLPGGFLELGETTSAGALRETREEAMAEAEVDALFTVIDVAHIGQVHMFYRAHMAGDHYAAGQESSEVAFMAQDEIPWRQLAFPTVYRTLELYFADRAAGRFTLHDEPLAQSDWKRMKLDMKPAPPDG